MSIYGTTDKVPEDFIITLINSTLISYYVDTFVNNTQTFSVCICQISIQSPSCNLSFFCYNWNATPTDSCLIM